MREYIFKEEKERFDKYLLRIMPMTNVGFLYKMLRKKNILLNGKKATGKEILTKGDKINIYFSEDTFIKFEGKDILEKTYQNLSDIPYKGLQIVYEDSDKILVNKPFGILSQKSAKDDISINEIILSYLINHGLSFEDFLKYKPSVANRLDRNTGGLILAAKTKSAAVNLTQNIKEKNIKRRYLTVVHGKLEKDGEYKARYIKDSENNRAKIKPFSSDTGDIVITKIEGLKYNRVLNTNLLYCELLTGKSHQIRAMAQFLGHPVVNDKKYGDSKLDKKIFAIKESRLPGQYLFAKEMEFPDGLLVEVKSPDVFLEIL